MSPLSPRARVLVVDDEASIRFVLDRALSQSGFEVGCAATLAEARQAARCSADAGTDGPAGAAAPSGWDLVLLDVRLPDGTGLELVPELLRSERPPQVVVMTARETMQSAVEAMKAGARDFLVKPFDLDRLTALAKELAQAPRPAPVDPEAVAAEPGRIVGMSPPMVELFKDLGRIAPTDVTVLVQGESGTGKELVARAVHDHSPRSGGPFVTVNCAAIPRDLMESELFGHERGSFTGAVERRQGKFELAQGGTLFLDEIGELSVATQARLLRVLQERVIERVGGRGPLAVDVRIVAATHRDLRRMVAEGAFREDLFYRLDVARLALPPLRERPGDVARLARAFVGRWAPELAGRPVELTADALALLEGHGWPGNVRELENVLKRALLGARGGRLDAEAVRGALGAPAAAPAPAGPQPAGAPLEALVEARLRAFLEQLGDDRPPEGLHAEILGRVERTLIGLVLEHAGGNQLEAARVLGINRNTLRKRIRELSIELPGRRRNRRRG